MNQNTQQMSANGTNGASSGSSGGTGVHVSKGRFETSLKDVQQIESIIRELGAPKGRSLHAISNETGVTISCIKARMALYNAKLMEIAQLKISRENVSSSGLGAGPGPGLGQQQQQQQQQNQQQQRQQQQLQLTSAQAKLIIHTAIALSLNDMPMPRALEQAEQHETQQARQWNHHQSRLKRYASY